MARIRLRDELKSGVQTIQYQINTLMTTNGQAPFVTLFLRLDDEDEYINENALIVEDFCVRDWKESRMKRASM